MSSEQQFTPPSPLNTAVLFLVFNRIEPTKQVFQAIRQAKPPRIYIAADGARQDKEGEAEKVKAVREYILENIDWDCEVKTLFRDKNLGCKYAVSGGITWFFENEEQGIILEDDCLPSQSFFWFCEELLNKYKDDLRVWHVSGDNFQDGKTYGEGSYYFSKYNHIWGWASWASRWRAYDVEVKSFDKFKDLGCISSIFLEAREQSYWLNVFNETHAGKVDTWDYQWIYTVLSNNGLSILPNKNLISNIGFGPEATHTTDLDSQLAGIARHDLDCPLEHPDFLLISEKADAYTATRMFIKRSLIVRIISKLKRTLK